MTAPPTEENPISFSFGKNWRAFNKTIVEEQKGKAREDILRWFSAEEIRGRAVADVGCGSGLHSLAFHLLGAGRVVSFDRDVHSVEATREHWARAGNPPRWSVVEGSVMERGFISDLGRFDIVYSWGVLHHTGSMWEAIGHATSLVADSGAFLVGIYAKGSHYPEHLALKQAYNRASPAGKHLMAARAIGRKMWKRLKHGKNPLAWNQKKDRGMDTYHDIVDWLGGLPYEVASEEEMVGFLGPKGFALERSQIKGEGGVSVYLFRRRANPGEKEPHGGA